VKGTTYNVAESGVGGKRYYMVRAIRLEETASGTFYNPSNVSCFFIFQK
jgi:hypothetical protein